MLVSVYEQVLRLDSLAPKRAKGVALALLALAATAPLTACDLIHLGPGPTLQVHKLSQLPKPLPFPYDENATPDQVSAEVDAAFAKAKTENRRVILDLGGNWCSWCRMLAATMALPEAKSFIDRNFEVVSVDVSKAKGKTDNNLALLHRFNLNTIPGFPWLIVAEPDGKVLNSSYEITDEHHQTPQSMVDWLAKWSKEPRQ